MLTTRGKLTVAQAARPAVVADCALCGGQAIFVVDSEHAAVDHRCGTGAVGPTWSLIERPRRTARDQAAAYAAGGVLTAEQAAAAVVRGGEIVLSRDQLAAGDGAAA